MRNFEQILATSFYESRNPQVIIEPYFNKIIFYNQGFLKLFELQETDVAQLVFTSLFKNTFGELHCFSEEVLSKGHAYSRRLFETHEDQEGLNPEVYGVRCSDQGTVYLHLIFYDLNARQHRVIDDEAHQYLRQGFEEWRKVERFFREVELQNQMILKAAGEGIYGVNADGVTTFVNHAAEEMLGWSDKELVGKDMHSMVHYAHQDGRHYDNEDCPIYRAFRLGQVTHVENEVFWRKDGKPMPVEYTSTPIVKEGQNVGAVIVFRDVSHRRQREEQLRQALEENSKLRERLEYENAYLQEEIRFKSHRGGIIGQSQAIKYLLNQVEIAAPTEANILITGESGTGKELVAHALHEASLRKDYPFIRVNCAAIPRELFESEFFGHTKGAFTGAIRERVGRFELANQGTIFLDEVGEIPLELQSKLLRVLQDQKFERIGEEKTRSANVRIIAATNRNLKAEVKKGNFREDLYFRLNVFPIECVPLRERKDDIPLLAEYFLQQAGARLKIEKPVMTIGNVNSLKAYSWPGNVRELQNIIERAAILSSHGKMIFDLPLIDFEVNQTTEKSINYTENRNFITDKDKILTSNEIINFERDNIKRALKHCNGRVSGDFGAAALLEMKPTTLYSKIKKYGLSKKIMEDM